MLFINRANQRHIIVPTLLKQLLEKVTGKELEN